MTVTSHTLIDKPAASTPEDFSLVLGGPLYQLWRGTRLTDDALHLQHRRVIAAMVVTWLPLLLLSLASGLAWGDSVRLPFLYDVESHVRLLLAVPLLLTAELIVHRRMRLVARQFLDRALIPDHAVARFDDAVAAAMRLRNSVWAEILLILVVYVVGIGLVWRTQAALDVPTWYRLPINGVWRPSPAGWWLTVVSLPIFQFLVVRWYFRLFIWARFLWQVSRIPLRLMPLHPDRCGGLGFLGGVSYAFAPVLVAQGVVVAGTIGNRIFYAGATLVQFKLELIAIAAVMIFVVLGPSLVFAWQLAAAKRAGLREYGTLAHAYVREFDGKWMRGGAAPEEPFIGSADIQSLADLGNSFEVVKQMRMVPFTLQTVLQLAIATLVPVLPLMLTMISLEELVQRLLTMVF